MKEDLIEKTCMDFSDYFYTLKLCSCIMVYVLYLRLSKLKLINYEDLKSREKKIILLNKYYLYII